MEKIADDHVRILIEYSNSGSPDSSIRLIDKVLPDYAAYIFLLFFLLPLSIIMIPVSRIKAALAPYQPSYEDADKWFQDGNGYLENLPEEEKEKFLSKEKNLPLGL